MEAATLKNYIGGAWQESRSTAIRDVRNPATGELLARVPLGTSADVDLAVASAKDAFTSWRRTPAVVRARYLFDLKQCMEREFEDLACTIIQEEGKTLVDARGEVRRAIESVEVACGIPSLMQGSNLEDVAHGIDTDCIRQPIGVFCVIPPFNFPLMVPMWFIPFAIACGNTLVVKPSEQVPTSLQRFCDLVAEVGLPAGVFNVVNGAREVVEAMVAHPDVRGISFVGSAPVARQVYAKAAAHGKRVQCLGGAKNFIVVLPDADLDKAVDGIMGSAFGAAGERCLAGSVVVAVGEVSRTLEEHLIAAAATLRVGNGADAAVHMGPVVSQPHKERVLSYIERGVAEGAHLALDGRGIAADTNGSFIGPTVFTSVAPTMTIGQEEIFGPVLSVMRARDLDEAIEIVNSSRYGNAASIFTASGKAAREFKYNVQCGMIGINVGVAAPMAMFPFAGWKDSFLGDLHSNGRDGVDFYTAKKAITSRWF